MARWIKTAGGLTLNADHIVTVTIDTVSWKTLRVVDVNGREHLVRHDFEGDSAKIVAQFIETLTN